MLRPHGAGGGALLQLGEAAVLELHLVGDPSKNVAQGTAQARFASLSADSALARCVFEIYSQKQWMFN